MYFGSRYRRKYMQMINNKDKNTDGQLTLNKIK